MKLKIAAAIVLSAFIAPFPTDADEARDRKLIDAGFVLRGANTPELMAQARRRLKPFHFVRKTSAQGVYYLYFDPDVCKCVFAGDERAMRTFNDMVSPGPMAPTIDYPGKPRGTSPEQLIEQEDAQDADDFLPDGLLGFRF